PRRVSDANDAPVQDTQRPARPVDNADENRQPVADGSGGTTGRRAPPSDIDSYFTPFPDDSNNPPVQDTQRPARPEANADDNRQPVADGSGGTTERRAPPSYIDSYYTRSPPARHSAPLQDTQRPARPVDNADENRQPVADGSGGTTERRVPPSNIDSYFTPFPDDANRQQV